MIETGDEAGTVGMVARLMALSARTAPKAKGMDTLVIVVVSGMDLSVLSREMRRIGEERKNRIFVRDA
ncbi:MAG: hypothetical protein LUQ17_03860, partial [Methanomicrobiales archaeon]|nr:hypothetical protein [Methanomicrobiales archaeon]